MGITIRVTAVSLIILACLCGCSAGGFQGSDNAPQGPAANVLLKSVNGVASKGIIRGGDVSIFALNSDGSVGMRLKTTKTNVFGLYSASLNVTGPMLVSVSGIYTDEATGLESVIPQDAPLRAAIDTLSSVMTIAVTPLTELAVRKSMPMLVGGNIAAANKLVSDMFRADIVATQPIDPTAQSFAYVANKQAQKDYTLALAAVSQMAHDYYGGSVSDTIAAMNNDLAKGDTLGMVTSGQLKTALTKFLQSSQNQTGIKDINATNLTNVGGGTKVIKLATRGTLEPGSSIYAITVTVALPLGVTVRVSDFALYMADSRAVYASGVFPTDIYTIGRFVPAVGSEPALLTVLVPQATGSGLGEFLTIVCDVPIGTSYTAPDFSLRSLKIVNGDGVELQGVSAEIL